MPGYKISTILFTYHDSTTAVSCETFCSDHIVASWVKQRSLENNLTEWITLVTYIWNENMIEMKSKKASNEYEMTWKTFYKYDGNYL